jgi:hypothetical protein
MPTPSQRPSLSTDLETRYENQRVGSAFDIKDVLKNPHSAPSAGDRGPVEGNENLYSVNDFAIKQPTGVTEFLDALDANGSTAAQSKQLSRYMKGFDNRKYKR